MVEGKRGRCGWELGSEGLEVGEGGVKVGRLSQNSEHGKEGMVGNVVGVVSGDELAEVVDFREHVGGEEDASDGGDNTVMVVGGSGR